MTATILRNSCTTLASPPIQSVANPEKQRVRPSEHRASGVHTFYVGSEARPGVEYSVQHIRNSGMNRWQQTTSNQRSTEVLESEVTGGRRLQPGLEYRVISPVGSSVWFERIESFRVSVDIDNPAA